jgi:acetolactate synthase-1/3 small subunit
VVNADDNTVEQVRKQLAKLVPVASLHDFQDTAYVESDLMLLTVAAPPERRGEIISLVNVFEGKITDVAPLTIMIEMTGSEEKLERFVELMRPYGIEELARTGVIAMSRGTQPARARSSGAKQVRERKLDAPAAVALPPS